VNTKQTKGGEEVRILGIKKGEFPLLHRNLMWKRGKKKKIGILTP